MHQTAQISTCIFENFPGAIPPGLGPLKTREGVSPVSLGARPLSQLLRVSAGTIIVWAVARPPLATPVLAERYEIFTFKLYCDLETGVRGHSRSLKVAP